MSKKPATRQPPDIPFSEATDEKDSDQIQALKTELALANHRLGESREELKTLLYHLSHDLRAPLRGIDGYSQALLEDYHDQLDVMGQAYLGYIRDASSRLSEVIEGLLKFYRINRAELEFSICDLSEIMQSISNDYASRFPEREFEFLISPGAIVQADYNMMYTLARCLLDNAVKFTSHHPSARIIFKVHQHLDERIFSIQDDGAGFNIAHQDQLFRPFQRLHAAYEFDGLGLGLAIASKIIQRHEGRIWAEAEEEKGATFYFTLKKEKK